MEIEVLGVREEGINTSRMTVVAGDTGLKLRVMALEDIYVVLELKEVSMMLTRKALAKGTVLNENPVVNFKEFRAEGCGVPREWTVSARLRR